MKCKYWLMHKDIPVALLVLDDTTNLVEGFKAAEQDHTPFLGKCNIDKCRKWWSMRAVPASRETMQKVIRKAGCINAEGYLAKNLALSMTDSYWICPYDSKLSYKDVRLSNLVDLDINRVPYHNDTSYDPNASLTGQMDKYWDLGHEMPELVKKSTAHYGLQALNEAFATKVHESQGAGIPFVQYEVEKIEDGGYSCRCRTFTSDDHEFVPALEIIESTKIPNDKNYYNGYIDLCAAHGLDRDEIQRFMDYQTLTDFVLSNEDEHLANFGILRDPQTLEFISPAPIFDTGDSMFFSDTRKKPYTRAELLERKITAFYPTEEKMLLNVSDKKIVDTEKLPSVSFVYEFYTGYGIPEEKVSFIAENYRKKKEMLYDFQKGIKISLYNEKRRMEANKSDNGL